MGKKGLVLVVIMSLIASGLFIGFFRTVDNRYKEIPYNFDLSGDNERIAWAAWGYLYIYDYRSGETILKTESSLGNIDSLSWSPDSKYLAVYENTDHEGLVSVYETTTAALVSSTSFKFRDEKASYGSRESYLQWSQDGRYLFSEINRVKPDITGDSQPEDEYEDLVVFNTSSWEIIWKNKVRVGNGYSYVMLSGDGSRLFHITGGDEYGTPVTEIFNWEDNSSRILYGISKILWTNSSTTLMYRYSTDQEDAAFLWYDLEENRFAVNVTADLYPGIVNYDGSLITLETSYEKNPIYSIASQEVVYNITHVYQKEFGYSAWTPEDGPISLFHQWGRYSNIIAYSNYYEDRDYYELEIFDMDTYQILGVIPEMPVFFN